MLSARGSKARGAILRTCARLFHDVRGSDVTKMLPSENGPLQVADTLSLLHAAHTAHHTLVMRESALKKFGPARDPAGDTEPTDARYALLSDLTRFDVAYVSVPASRTGSSDVRAPSFPVADSVSDDMTVERVHKVLTIDTATGPFRINYGWSAQRTTMDMGLNGALTKLTLATPLPAPSTAASEPIVAVSSYSGSDKPSDSELTPEGAAGLDALLAALRTTPAPAAGAGATGALSALTDAELRWWLCYACTHPSNWAFDRITMHLLPRP